MSDLWQAATARHRFSELVEAAVEGRLQFVRRRDGREVVIVSREYFEQTKPSLKTILLSMRFGNKKDEFDSTLDEARRVLGESLAPNCSLENKNDSNPGHQRSKRASTPRT